jgi:phage shock protein C
MSAENRTRRLYRSRDGYLLGVCRGIADYFGVDVFWTRAVAIVVFVVTGLWPLTGLYILAVLFMPLEPVLPVNSDADEEFYNAYAHSRSMAVQRLKRIHEHTERRLRRLEGIVTARDFDWRERLNRME